jgi:hypothetical protein
MAQVDTGGYLPSAVPTGIPDNMQQIDATPDAFGAAAAEGQARLGAGLSQAGDNIGQTVQDLATIHNQAKMNDAFNTLQTTINSESYGDPSDPSKPGFMALQGKDVMDAYTQSADRIEALRSQLASSLPPSIAASFDQASRRYVTSTLGEYGQHVIEAQRQWADTSNQESLNTDLNTAVLNRNSPTLLNTALDNSRTVIQAAGVRNGWDQDTIDQEINNNQSAMNMAVAKAKANDNPQDAWNYYQSNKGSFTAVDQLEAEHFLKPLVMAAQASKDADAIMSGTPGVVAQSVTQEAQNQGVDPVLALTTAKIESGMGVRPNNPNSQAFGVFGMMPGTWQQQGGGNPSDVTEQVRVGVKNLADSQRIANTALGGNAQPWQVYIVHQQGPAGGPALLTADPNTPAVDALTPAYKGNSKAALAAITANGGSGNMTAGQFLSMWQSNYAAASAAVGTPPPVPGANGVAASSAAGGTYEAAVGPNAGKMVPLSAGGSATATAAAPPGVPTSPNPGDHLNDWVTQANGITDPFGQNNPDYQRLVEGDIRSKAGAIQAQQEQQDRQSNATLLTGALGITGATGGASGPATVAPPVTLDQLLSTPAMKTAWATASPETRQAIMGVVEKNSSAGPPVTAQAQSQYYQLLGESTRDPQTFLRENFADSGFLSTMPRTYVSSLMLRQADIDGTSQAAQQRQISMAHARDVMTPDLVTAGINPRLIDTNPAVAQQYADFSGRLDEAFQKFQAANKGQTPDDAQIKAMGETLLTPGYLKGTGSLWGMLPNDTSSRLYQASTAGKGGQFYPAVPAADRQQIIAAYGARYKGVVPTDAQIEAYYMAGRQPPARPAPRRTIIQSSGASPFASAKPSPGSAGTPAVANAASTPDQTGNEDN